MKLQTFADVHAALRPYWPSQTARHRHGLDHMYRLLEHLGNPHQRLQVVHVAGTSGKSSTAYYTAALLQAAGKHVGLTVSPHVDEVNERVQIDLVPLSEAEFAPRFGEYLDLVKASGVTPNYFELFMTFALWEFAARGVDYAVVEVGIGGLLDSTNVFEDARKVCIITDIGFDHTKVLGGTLSEIAAQKAGIVQLHNALFCYQQSGEVMNAFQKQSAIKHADLHVLTSVPVAAVHMEFLPLFQQRNFGLALRAVQFIAERDHLPALTSKNIRAAAAVYIPARMEQYSFAGKTLILDGAHNAQKVKGLLRSVRAVYGEVPTAILIRISDYSHMGKRATAITHQLELEEPHVTVIGSSGDSVRAFNELTERPEPVIIVAGFVLLYGIRPIVGAKGAVRQLQATKA